MKLEIKSNLRILMALNNINSLRELGQKANLSWKIISNLDNNVDIENTQIGNLIKVCNALNTTLDNLIEINYGNRQIDKSKIEEMKSLIRIENSETENSITSNLRLLMALNNIKTLKELEKLSNTSWKILSNLDKNTGIDTIRLINLLKVCVALNCTLGELLNINQ